MKTFTTFSENFQFIKNGKSLLLALVIFLFSFLSAYSQVSYTTLGSTYTQDFQSITPTALTPAAIVLTSMLEVSSLGGGGTVSGWYIYHQGGASPRWGRSDGSSNTGSLFGMYDAQATPARALGSQGSASLVARFGTVIQNNTGSTINAATISYDAVMNRNPSTTVNNYPMSYLVNSAAIVSGSSTAAGTFNDLAGTWTAVTGFTTPAAGSGIGAPGTQAVINPMFKIGSTITQTLTGLNWAPGQYLYIRWNELDEGGADATAGVDNFSLSTTGSSSTITGSALAPSSVSTTYGTASASSAFNVSGAGMTAGILVTPPAGFEVSLSASSGFANSITVGAAGSIATTPIYVRLKSTATVASSPYSGNIVLSSSGATSVNLPIGASAISPLAISTSGAIASNKIYNGNNIALITGAIISGATNGDVLTVNGNGSFSSVNVGTGISVTSNLILSGTNATSYSLTQPSGLTANITQLPISITGINANNKAFDGNTSATLSGTASLLGVLATDVSNVVLANTYTANFNTSAIGTNKPITVLGYTISGSASGNYLLNQPSGLTANITSSPTPNITSSLSASFVYGSVAPTYTISASNSPTTFSAIGLPSGLIVNTMNGQISGTPSAALGSYTVTISASNIGGAGTANLVITLTAKTLTVSNAIGVNKIYDGLIDATISGSILNGVFGSDVVSITNSGTFADKNIGVAKAITSTQILGGVDASKYILQLPSSVTSSITPKEITIFGAVAQNKIVDGNTNATITGTIAGVVSPEAVSIIFAGTFASGAVGNNISVTSNSTLSGADIANYFLTQPTGLIANITSAPAGLAAGDIAVIAYNTSGAPDNFSILVLKDLAAGTIFYVNDNELANSASTAFTDLSEAEASFTVKAGQTIPAGTVIVLPWGAAAVSATTYDWSVTTSAGFGNSSDEIYIYTAPTLTSLTPTAFIYYTKIGSALGAIPSTLSLGTTAINPTGSGLRYSTTGATYNDCIPNLLAAIGNTGTNWNSIGAATITPADWTFTVLPSCGALPIISSTSSLLALSTIYGTPSTNTTFTISGADMTAGINIAVPAGFEVSLNASSGFANSITVGAAGIIAPTTIYIRLQASASVSNSPYSGNIVLTSAGATLVNIPTVSSTVAALTVTVSNAVASNKIYDGNTATLITGAIVNGLVNADVITVSGDGNFVNANVGNTKSVTTNLILSGVNASSYILTQPSGLSANISTLSLTIAGLSGVNKLFNGNTAATLSGTGSLSGVLASDAANVVLSTTYTANFVSSAIGSNVAITVSGFTISGSASANYSVLQPTNLVANITAAPTPVITSTLTVTATYGTLASTYSIVATQSPTSYSATNLPIGLSINISNGQISGIPTSPVGVYTIVITATNIGGPSNANLVYTITPKPITIISAFASSKVYDATNIASINGSTLVGVVGADVVTVSATGTFANKNVGTSIVVTSTQTLGGTDANNYSLILPNGLSADITVASVAIVNAAAQNKSFDGTTAATIIGILSGVISPDVVSANLVGTFASSAIANGIVVTPNITLSGADANNYLLTQPTGLVANITEQIIYVNAFTGVSACPTNGNLPTMAINATGTPLSRTIITCNATANVFNSATLNNSATVSNTSFIEFSATAAAGNVLNISSLSFFRQASNSAPNQIAVRYSTDGFATSTSWATPPNSTPSGTVATWDMTDFSTPIAGTVIFRVYPYGTQRSDGTPTAAATSGTFRLDDVTIYGIVTAPTGSTSAVLSGNTVICSGASTNININITSGTSPYTIVYNNGVSNVAVNNYISNANISVSPITTTTYSIVSITDASSNAGINNSGSAIVTVNQASTPSSVALSNCGSVTLPNNQIKTTSGAYPITYSNAANCDSVVTYNVTIKQASTPSNVALSNCGSVTLPNNQIKTTSGAYPITYSNAANCDSVVTYNVTIKQTSTPSSVALSNCGSVTLPNNQIKTISGAYPITYSNAANCDSVVTYNVTIKQASTPSSVSLSNCGSVTLPNNQIKTISGAYPITYSNAANCDSVVTYNVTIKQASTPSSVSLSNCGSVTLPNNQIKTTSGAYPITYSNAANCDSVVTYNVTIKQASTPSSVALSNCGSVTLPNNQIKTTSGAYPITYSNAANCDSVVTYNVTIKQASTPSSVALSNCGSVTLPNNQIKTISGAYPITYSNAANCDSVVTYNVTIKQASTPSSVSLSNCGSVTLPNNQIKTTSGAYPITYSNAANCDSVVTYNVTIKQASTPSNVALSNCGSVTLPNNQIKTISGAYPITYSNAANCDSVVTYNVTIKQASTLSSVSLNNCGFVTLPNNQIKTISGAYPITYSNAANCDSVVTYNVTIKQAITFNTTAIGVNSFTLPWGVIVTASGIYTNNFAGAASNGCDSIVSINVSLNVGVQLAAKVFLAGAYKTNTNLMTDSLRILGLIPNAQPYSDAIFANSFTHVGSGSEYANPSVFQISGANAIVDWVFIQVRDANNSSNVIATRCALLQSDGDIVDVDGISPVSFPILPTGNYFVSVKHRNHLGVMTANTMALGNIVNAVPIDFTNLSTSLYSKSSPNNNVSPLTGATKIVGGKRCLYAGNCNISSASNAKFVSYSPLLHSDRSALYTALPSPTASINGYTVYDMDLNGYARFNGLNPDRLIIFNTCIGSNAVTVIEQLP
jgi:YDG domain